MSPPVVRVNTIVQSSGKLIDRISSVFVITEFLFGINRLTVLMVMSKFNKILTSVYTVAMFLFIIGVMSFMSNICDNILMLVEYILYGIFSIISGRRLSHYYAELRRFDGEAGCEFKKVQGSIRNLVFSFCIVIAMLLFFFICIDLNSIDNKMHHIPVILIHIIELHFYGHLLSLLVQRLKIINYYMESSISSRLESVKANRDITILNRSTEKSNYHLLKLVKLYEILLHAYDLLIDAIKWMLVLVLTWSFILTLLFSYETSLAIIFKSKSLLEIASRTGVAVLGILALFAPCIFSDQLHGEVRKFRELLAYRLYNNDMDKESRRAARSLVQVTATRNLAFSLLRMLSIDVSLPFKFIGLIITYLIILLQFQKVTNL